MDFDKATPKGCNVTREKYEDLVDRHIEEMNMRSRIDSYDAIEECAEFLSPYVSSYELRSRSRSPTRGNLETLNYFQITRAPMGFCAVMPVKKREYKF